MHCFAIIQKLSSKGWSATVSTRSQYNVMYRRSAEFPNVYQVTAGASAEYEERLIFPIERVCPCSIWYHAIHGAIIQKFCKNNSAVLLLKFEWTSSLFCYSRVSPLSFVQFSRCGRVMSTDGSQNWYLVKYPRHLDIVELLRGYAEMTALYHTAPDNFKIYLCWFRNTHGLVRKQSFKHITLAIKYS